MSGSSTGQRRRSQGRIEEEAGRERGVFFASSKDRTGLSPDLTEAGGSAESASAEDLLVPLFLRLADINRRTVLDNRLPRLKHVPSSLSCWDATNSSFLFPFLLDRMRDCLFNKAGMLRPIELVCR